MSLRSTRQQLRSLGLIDQITGRQDETSRSSSSTKRIALARRDKPISRCFESEA